MAIIAERNYENIFEEVHYSSSSKSFWYRRVEYSTYGPAEISFKISIEESAKKISDFYGCKYQSALDICTVLVDPDGISEIISE